MKLSINEINHRYIVRIVIMSLFIYKNQIRDPRLYSNSVINFVKKRIFWKIDLRVDTGIKLDKEEEREIILEELLEGIESDYLKSVTVTFTTPLKSTTIKVDLSEENKYEEFLYS